MESNIHWTQWVTLDVGEIDRCYRMYPARRLSCHYILLGTLSLWRGHTANIRLKFFKILINHNILKIRHFFIPKLLSLQWKPPDSPRPLPMRQLCEDRKSNDTACSQHAASSHQTVVLFTNLWLSGIHGCDSLIWIIQMFLLYYFFARKWRLLYLSRIILTP